MGYLTVGGFMKKLILMTLALGFLAFIGAPNQAAAQYTGTTFGGPGPFGTPKPPPTTTTCRRVGTTVQCTTY